MEFRYVPSPYSADTGLQMEWERGFSITVKVDGSEVVLQGNREGLISLARHLLALAQEDVPPGSHWHYSPGLELEDNSVELIIERLGSG